jgi:hypothetical protein
MSREVSCSIRMRRQGKSSLAMVRIAAWISILCWSIPDWNLLYWFVFFIGFYGDQAAVVRGPKQPFLMETIRVEPPRKMEVRIKILYTSICHTDLSAWKGEVTYITLNNFNLNLLWCSLSSCADHNKVTDVVVVLKNEAQRAYPRILGHEAVG